VKLEEKKAAFIQSLKVGSSAWLPEVDFLTIRLRKVLNQSKSVNPTYIFIRNSIP